LKGAFVISLDFELYWGVRDSKSIDAYKEHILGVKEVIPSLLQLFKEFNIHATFAIVGLLTFEDKTTLIQHMPNGISTFTNDAYTISTAYLNTLGNTEAEDPFHFGYSLLKQIQATEQHEIASHTFTHYYTLEEGATLDYFKADIEAYKTRATELGIELNTIIFPRNQFNDSYLTICKDASFQGYRGTEKNWMYRPISRKNETLLRRLSRLADAYINISGMNSYNWSTLKDTSGLYNISSSRFLRPYSRKLRFFEYLRLKRIKNAMTHAAMNEEVFHLWWHPHNFGKDLKQNIAFLRSILEHQHTLQKIYGFESRTMKKCYSIINSYEQR
jgi:peptidoglycan/xylan/chitin deacetylase (PgdA/CDA1 family)